MRALSRFLILLICYSLTMPVNAQEKMPSDANDVKKNVLEKLDKLINDAKNEAESFKKSGEPRRVNRGGAPEVIVKDDTIFFSNKKLQLGNSLASWKEVIAGAPRCLEGSMTLCIWDSLGIEVGTDHSKPQKVSFFVVYLNIFDEHEEFMKTVYPNGRPDGDLPDLKPHRAFSGFLELDGFGIDAKTKFWEIRSSVAGKRELRCGLLDCGFPAAAFGTTGHIYMNLDGQSENSTVKRISIEGPD